MILTCAGLVLSTGGHVRSRRIAVACEENIYPEPGDDRKSSLTHGPFLFHGPVISPALAAVYNGALP